MDIVTHGLLGAAAAQAGAKKDETRLAILAGFAAGILADGDALIRSADDPLLNIEFHRHFSHSLLFIPLGGLIASLILWPLLRHHLAFKRLYLLCLLAYSTSGLLDACTSYGTQLLWPFSNERIAWSIIAIVDPVFSLTLLGSIIWSARKCIPRAAQAGLLLAGSYLILGSYQHQQAHYFAQQQAELRGHRVERLMVKPTMANLLLWRSIYESEGVFHVDGIRISPFSASKLYPGRNAKRFVAERDLPGLKPDSALHHDVQRFLQFSDNMVILDPTRESVLIDVRYSMLPISLAPLWGINLKELTPAQHAQFINYRDRSADVREKFITMLLGKPLPEQQP